MKTKDEKIEILYAAIDAILEAAQHTNVDTHFFVNSEKSVIQKLRNEIWDIENN